jgi:hypothetical protein
MPDEVVNPDLNIVLPENIVRQLQAEVEELQASGDRYKYDPIWDQLNYACKLALTLESLL